MPKPKEIPKQSYNVEVYKGKSIAAVLTVKAIDAEDASNEAFKVFFKDIRCKVKRNYGN